MKAIILVGGFGTRLREVVVNIPKPMAPIQGKPFLAHLLNYLKNQGITEVVLCVHYLKEQFQDYFKENYSGIKIDYAIEDAPLGTGGAIKNGLQKIADDQEAVFVLNGDTFVMLDYQVMYQQHLSHQARMTIALREVADCSRYGNVIVDDRHIIQFQEKGKTGVGLINAGVYLLSRRSLANFALPGAFSFETNLLFPYLKLIKPEYFLTQQYFIDIGIPEDYERAQKEIHTLEI